MNPSGLINSALDELLERVRPLLALVWQNRRGAGAGVLVGEGSIVTNLHVVGQAHSVQVELADGQQYEGRMIASDPHVDLALLEIPANTGAAAILSEREPRPGELVYAFGHPWGQRNVLTGGVLSAVTRLHGQEGDVPVLRADVSLAPGNSGGPLLNAAGEVLGLNAMIFGGDQSVAIPASLIRTFLENARKTRVPEGVL